MVFSSVEFILIFLPVFLIAYYITPVSYRNVILLLGSLIFYAYGEPKFVLLLIVSMLVNYFLARGIVFQKSISRSFFNKLCFLIALILNLALLLVFKIAPGKIGLPLGISFFTFQSISYLIDVYRGEIEAETSFVKLGTYICMFPQLVAGPIVAYHEVAATLNRPVVSSSDFDDGLKDFSVGLILKVLMADRLSLLWNEIAKIGYISAPSFLLWMGSVSYSLQIYFDFFGYSLMAIGLGKMLGFRLPKNFDLPYTATSIREFYRRWHITLGRWFAKYVYIPLGGSRGGILKTLCNLFVVWILTSLWHGVSVNFLLWGMLLCLVIMTEKISSNKISNLKKDSSVYLNTKEQSYEKNISMPDEEIKTGENKLKLDLIIWKTLKHAYVLFVIVISWTCFAISDMGDLATYLGRMFGVMNGICVNYSVLYNMIQKFGLTILIGIFLCTKPAHNLYHRVKNSVIGSITIAILFWLSVWYIHIMGNNPFLYFRF